MAHNTHGAGPSSDQLSVATQGEEHVPSAPQHVHAHATGASSVRVQWQPPHTTNGALRGYRLYYMDPDGGVERSADVPPTVESHELTGLTPYTEYGVWLAAVNSNGAGASSRDISVRTYGAAPGDPPYNVTVEPAGATALVVRWEPPPRDALNGVVTGYKLRYRRVGRRGDTITTAGDARSHTLTDLDRSSTYQIRLSAINTNGSGPATDWLSADTYDNEPDESTVPSEPSPLRVRPTSDSIHVSWSPPGTGTTPARNVHVRKYILGWGKGIPDYFAHELDEKTRQYTIANLEPNSEYVISLRASNSVGPGPARYANVRTRDDQPPEPQLPLMPPVGLKAQVLSSSTVVLYWTDATLSKSQYATDQRHYVVRYEAVVSSSATKQRTYNATELNCMITDLRPNTQYEFTVKVVKGRRESPWSMVVTNTTYPSAPGTAPRDLSVAQDGAAVRLAWQPPKLTNGPITGYVIFYTTDASRRDRDWLVEGVLGDRHATLIHGLRPDQHYVFKIQARNSKGVGPFSATAALRTSHGEYQGQLNVACVRLLSFLFCCFVGVGTGVVSHDSRYKGNERYVELVCVCVTATDLCVCVCLQTAKGA